MILVTNGDSWTQGDKPASTANWDATKSLDWYNIPFHFGSAEEIPEYGHKDYPHSAWSSTYKFYDSDVWPKVLGRKLGVETWNCGRLGDDNYSIMYRTIRVLEWLKRKGKKDFFVIIGLSSPYRVPAFRIDENKRKHIDQIRPFDMGDGIEFFKQYTQQWKPIDMTLLSVYTLQCYFEANNIDYLFFNAFDKLDNLSTVHLLPLINKEKWYGPLGKDHFYSYIKRKTGAKDWNEEPYFSQMHPTDISHTMWAEHLYKCLNKTIV